MLLDMILILFVCSLLLCIFTISESKGQRYCQGRGYRNSYGKCVCSDGYYGANCEYKRCPFGKSWLAPPNENDVRYTPLAICSDMGYCNSMNGTCTCRSGYEGAACERMACPVPAAAKLQTSSTNLQIVANADGTLTTVAAGSSTAATTTSSTVYPPCAGHGVCMTLRQAAKTFNGLTLVNPPIDYENWDADRIQGCICDPGYQGYDCSQRVCPKGKDPTVPGSVYDKDETFIVECQADSGFFSILVLGYYTEPIPYDADPGYLKFALQALPNVGNVEIRMQSDNDTALPAVCAPDKVIATEIVFLDYHGDRPPIFLTRNTSNTRQWPTGGERLTLSTADDELPILRMATMHWLECPPCPDCFGRIYFTYRNSVSSKVNITSNNATANIISAVLGIDELLSSGWSNLGIEVTINGISYAFDSDHVNNSVCQRDISTTTVIKLVSDYGNIDFLGLLDGSSWSPTDKRSPANITFVTNAANGTLFECSNQGSCDYGSGMCQCVQDLTLGVYNYRAISSDGKGNLGGRGDCGYIAVNPNKCLFAGLECSGHGVCNNETYACTCYDEWFGILCSFKQCPEGRAFFDEPIANDTAHQYAECSNAGTCDRRTGYCVCRSGFTGPACEIKDCPRDSSTGEACYGHGVCVSMASYYQTFGLSYGNASLSYVHGGRNTWDAYTWFECLCTAQISAGFIGNPLVTSVGPVGLISGYPATSPPLPGWGGYDCNSRNCPRGHNTDTNTVSKRDVQRVICDRDETTTGNSSMFFMLKLPFGDEKSLAIYDTDGADEIKSAIEYAGGVGNVTVWFPLKDVDYIKTACNSSVNSTYGGFLVSFDTEYGNLDLMSVLINDQNITISKEQDGYSTNEECSGPTLGYCNRDTGVCACNERQTSSNGLDQPGLTGDCSYFIGIPRSDDSYSIFGMYKSDPV